MTWSDQAARERVGRVERLIGALDDLPEPAHTAALDAVAGLVEIYGEALGRIVDMTKGSDTNVMSLAGDELVRHLLIVHDLHPVDVETRVRGALDEVRPYLSSHGGDVELAGIAGTTARLVLTGSCDGCPSSAATLRLAIEDAIREAAPEIEHVVADDVAPAPPGRATWRAVGSFEDLAPGTSTVREELLFVRLRRSLYAYRPTCPGCGASLAEATLEGSDLGCAGCGRRFGVAVAGRCRDDAALHLEPVPLLTGADGDVRIALQEVLAA